MGYGCTTKYNFTGGSDVLEPGISFSALEEQILLLKEATDAVLLDTIGLGQKMQEAFERHADSTMSSQVLWKALQTQD
jgi:hypothetical protein